MAMQEEWRKVPGLPESIEVSNLGKVREVVYNSDPIEHGVTISGGYVKINYRGKQYALHRLIAKAFLDPDLSDDTFVKHADNDRNNNSVSNLVLVASEDLRADSYKAGKRYRCRIRCVETGKVYATLYSAHAFTLIPKEAISANALGNTESCFGFHFEYLDPDEYVDPSTVLYKSYLDVVQESEFFDSYKSYVNTVL